MKIFNWIYKKPHIPQRSLQEIKRLTKILFIDDVKFEVVDRIKTNGWTQCTREKDIEDLDHPDIDRTHIFFVDIQGVGKKLNFPDEGLGLARALKQKYPSKAVILYSSEGQRDIFDATLSIVDARIRKNADTYEFLKLAENFALEAFSLNECLIRIQKIIKEETGEYLDVNLIKTNLLKVQGKGEIDKDKIVKAFKVTGQAASIIGTILKTIISQTPSA
jgi:hypothetical protein